MQHCGWSANAPNGVAVTCDLSNMPVNNPGNACDGGKGYACWSMAPWAVNDTLGYGYAAVPADSGIPCGTCYELEFTGVGHSVATDPGSVSLLGKKMIVQVSNVGYDVDPGQFDLMIPGGGVGLFDACSTQLGVANETLGSRYGGLLSSCNRDVACLRASCESVFGDKPELLRGCLFHADWMGGADNPEFTYVQVACPVELSQASGMPG